MNELNASLAALRKEIGSDPLERYYATMTATEILADLTEPRYISLSERMISERTLFAVLGATRATALLDALDAMPDRTMQRICRMLGDVTAGGVDVSLAESRGMIDQFAAAGLLTADEAATIKALAEQRTSRAQQIGYNELTAQMVERVLEVL